MTCASGITIERTTTDMQDYIDYRNYGCLSGIFFRVIYICNLMYYTKKQFSLSEQARVPFSSFNLRRPWM